MSPTMIMLKAWIDAVLKPRVVSGVREGIPLDELGRALIGYGAAVLRKGCGMSQDAIRAELEAVFADNDSPPS